MTNDPQYSNRLGDILVQKGVLTGPQVDAILTEQKESNKPFGLLAQTLFGVTEESIWGAYAKQMEPFFQDVDLACEQRDREIWQLLTVREAWCYLLLPLRRVDNMLVCATTRERLPEAMAFANNRFDVYVDFVLADRLQIENYIMQQYVKNQSRANQPLKACGVPCAG